LNVIVLGHHIKVGLMNQAPTGKRDLIHFYCYREYSVATSLLY